MPPRAISVRIHSVGGWGAITMGKNLSMTVFELLGMQVKANPKYGSEKKGQPTTFYATFAHQPIRLNCELRHVDVSLSPDPNVFRHSNPLAGLSAGGAFVIQSDLEPADLWTTLPATARREILDRKIRVYALDAFRIAARPVPISTRVSPYSRTLPFATLIIDASHAFDGAVNFSSAVAAWLRASPEGCRLNVSETAVPLLAVVADGAETSRVTWMGPATLPDGNSTEAPAGVLTVPPVSTMVCSTVSSTVNGRS